MGPNKADGRQIQPFGQDDDDDIQEVVPVKSEPRDTSNVIATPSPYPAPSHSQALANPEMDDSMSNYGQDDSYDDYGQYGADGGDQSYDGALVDPNMVAADGNKGDDLDGYILRDDQNARHAAYRCGLCSSFSHNSKYHVRNHVESKHFPNTYTYNCHFCDKTTSTRKAL